MDAYKGYQPAMEWDANAGEWSGHVRDIADTMTFRVSVAQTASGRECADRDDGVSRFLRA